MLKHNEMGADVKSSIASELHRSARRRYPRRRVITHGIDDLHQADLVEMIPYSRANKGFKYILMVIDVYSKYAWAAPLKNKSAAHVLAAIQHMYKLSARHPQHLQTDQGKEFHNSVFRRWASSNNINHYSTYSNVKASVVERLNRTIKQNMWKTFTAQGTYRWLELLPKLIHRYNHTRHRTIGMRPVDVKNNQLLTTVYSHIKRTPDPSSIKFRVGDWVRVSKHKHQFDKGYSPNWSTELFTIDKIQLTSPVTYLLRDLHQQPISGCFYSEELQKTRHRDTYLVERVVQRRNKKVLVKWLGFPATQNSWIDSNNIVL